MRKYHGISGEVKSIMFVERDVVGKWTRQQINKYTPKKK